ncbi:MAG: glycosyltransferase family 4 protein [Elusimicrobia bacterium]|nr:glycosyltransferase family 4 protein [Elusimicrobiota bacterium]
MRIGIDCRELTGRLTGISRILINLLRYISENDSPNEFVLFGNQKTKFDYDFLKNAKFDKKVINSNIAFLWDQFQLKNALVENKVDLFYSPYYKMPVFTKIPSIISLLDLTYFVVEPYSNKLFYNMYLKFLIKMVSGKAKKVITCSEYSKRDIVNILGIPEQKIEVIYLGISERFQPAGQNEITSLKSRYNLEKKYILYTGNKNEHKNLNRLVSAFNLLPDDMKSRYHLVLAGVDQHHYKVDGVKALGHINDDDLPILYSGAHLLVIPSLYEGFGLPALEAMACGCPVISSNTSSMPEIFGSAPLYFNPFSTLDIKNRMVEVLDNEALASEMRQKGFERVKIFTIENMSKKFIKVFEG